MMVANYRKRRPSDGRHPPPLAPTVSSFKPRAQWTNSGSSILLYVNLPGFYEDQIEIKKDLKTRTVQIQGQRPLSTQTKARFFESYRVPDSCDMTKSNTSFSHGLLTIEFPTVVEGEKQEKAVKNQGKNVQKSSEEKSGGVGTNGSSLGRNKHLGEEKQAAPKLNEKEPKTYESVVEGKKVVPTGSPKKSEPKVRATEATPSLGSKEHAKEEKLVEKKEADQIGQQKIVQKLKEKEAISSPTLGGNLKPKVRVKEKKVIERKKDGERNQDKNGQQPTIDASLERKVDAKVVERKEDGEINQDPKEEVKTNLGQKKQEIYTKPVVSEGRTEKKVVATKQAEPEIKMKERDKGTALNGVEVLKTENDEKIVGDKLSEIERQERAKQKVVEKTGLGKETGDLKDNIEAVEPKTGPLLVDEMQKKVDMELPPAVGEREMDKEESRTYDISLVNVGAAALVIMGFGAYVFVPLVKLFS